MKKTLDDYMNDPSIVNEPMPVREVHAIRLMIEDETKGMSIDERNSFVEKRTDPIIKKYNIKKASLVPRK